MQVQDLTEKSVDGFRQYKDDSTMIRGWSEDSPTRNSSSRTCLLAELVPLGTGFWWKNAKFRVPATSYNLTTEFCACHEKLRSNIIATWPNIALATKAALQLHQILPLPQKVAPQHHCSSLLYSILFTSTLLCSSLLYILLYSIFLYSELFCALLYCILLFSTLLYSSLL